jgi:phenylalanyl-tRNA synthetase alpha chain
MPSEGAPGIIADLDRLAAEFAAEIGAVVSEQEIRAAQARYLGKKGRVSELMKALGRLPPTERPAVGEAANRAKALIESAVAARLAALGEVALAADLARTVDVTLPGRGVALGTLHPLTLVRREIETIFLGLGFEVRTGPWIESEWNNFDALNTPPDHPARDMQDTFFVEGGRILRSHTSPVQIRTMLGGPPRSDRRAGQRLPPRRRCHAHADVSDGRGWSTGVSFADLGDAAPLRSSLLGPNLGIRLRLSYFPFNELSAESTPLVTCAPATDRSRGGPPTVQGQRLDRDRRSEMVHPNVFRAVGYDPKAVTGFAFGMGLSRMAMLKYEVDDLRSFYEHDARFLAQFR